QPAIPLPSNSVDSNSYLITVTPQQLPTLSDGTNTYALPAGSFVQMSSKQLLNTSGNLSISTNGDSSLLVPIVMPSVVVTGSVTGLTGANGSAAPIVLYATNNM